MGDKFTYLVVNATTRTAFVGKEYASKSSATRAANLKKSRQRATDQVDVMVLRTYMRDRFISTVREYADIIVFPTD